jgi:hypothetical protein
LCMFCCILFCFARRRCSVKSKFFMESSNPYDVAE